MTTRDYLIELHRKCSHNREALAVSKIFGCFYCLGQFEYQKISEWIDKDDTAICPLCGIDSVLDLANEPSPAVLLREMHDLWFDKTVRLTKDEWKDAVQKNAWPSRLINPSRKEGQ